MIALAWHTARARSASLAGSFIATALGVALLTVMTLILASTIGAPSHPRWFTKPDVVVAGDNSVSVTTGSGDNHIGFGKPARMAGRTDRASQDQCHHRQQRYAERGGDEAAGQAGTAGPRGVPRQRDHERSPASSRPVIRAATDCAVGSCNSPATWPSARNSTRSAWAAATGS